MVHVTTRSANPAPATAVDLLTPPPELAAVWADLGIVASALAGRRLRLERSARTLVPAEAMAPADAPPADADPSAASKPPVWQLTPPAALAWRAMKAAAAADGVVLTLVSAYRSVERQAELIRRRLDAGDTLDQVLSAIAPPGCSEHHTGRAVDIGTPGAEDLEEAFADTAAYAWLQQHAGRFGFTLSFPRGNVQGYTYEPWHWCHQPSPD